MILTGSDGAGPTVVATFSDDDEVEATEAAQAEPAEQAEPARYRRTVALIGLEALLAVAAAALMVVWARRIEMNPMDRVAQVSAQAHLQLQLWVIGGAAILVALAGARWAGRRFAHLVEPVACSIVAGLATSFVGGAIVVGLNGTPWGVGGRAHDVSALVAWANAVTNGQPIPSPVYPPAFVHLLSWVAQATGQPAAYAMKDLQIIGCALLGPLTYLTWRLVLRPVWALSVGTVAVLPLVDGYKPFAMFALVLSIPVFVATTQAMRRADRFRLLARIGIGAGIGAAVALLVLLHPIYTLWPAPGVVVAVLLLTPWRRAWRQAATLAGSGLIVFGLLAGRYLYQFFTAVPDTKENYFYFDAYQEPTYFLMWRITSRPVGDWPPPGEVGGVGLFGLLVAAAIGVALALAYRRSLVATLICCFASVWVFRLYLAARMYGTHEVNLWPRTSMLLLYCALLLVGAAIFAVARVVAGRIRDSGRTLPPGAGVLGVVVAVLLVFGMSGSATSKSYLPDGPRKAGTLMWQAQHTRLLDGTCSRYATYCE